MGMKIHFHKEETSKGTARGGESAWTGSVTANDNTSGENMIRRRIFRAIVDRI